MLTLNKRLHVRPHSEAKGLLSGVLSAENSSSHMIQSCIVIGSRDVEAFVGNGKWRLEAFDNIP